MSTINKPTTPAGVADTLAAIRADLRSAMNGVAAQSIRESGMAYRLVYGVELPRLREIAASFAPDRQLALQLWQSEVREEKMLALLLFPSEAFDRDLATLWAESLRPEQAELAGLMSMELLVKEPYAPDLAFVWMADERPMLQLCGFQTLTRLLMQGARLAPDAADEFRDQAESALHADFLPLRKAAQNALIRFEDSQNEHSDMMS